MDEKTLSLLRQVEFFKHLSQEELSLLANVVQKMTFEKEEFIIHEGEEAKNLYVILSGVVEVIKKEKKDGHQHQLATLGPGETFGEMALFGDTKRSASIRTLKKTEILAIPIAELELLAKKHTGYTKVATDLAKHIADRLRSTNEIAVASLSKELDLNKENTHMGHVIIHLIILMTLYFYTFRALSQYASATTINIVITSLLIFCYGISAVLLVKRSHYPLTFFGLNFKKWKRNAFEGIVYTIPILVVMVIIKAMMLHLDPLLKDQQLFGMPTNTETYLFFFHKTVQEKYLFGSMLIYILLVPVQEFIVRGCLQGCLENFFRIPHKAFWAILVSNLLFGMFHGFQTISFALIAFVLGLFWGWLYSRQRSIIGPTLSHILIGIWGLLFLNFQHILSF